MQQAEVRRHARTQRSRICYYALSLAVVGASAVGYVLGGRRDPWVHSFSAASVLLAGTVAMHLYARWSNAAFLVDVAAASPPGGDVGPESPTPNLREHRSTSSCLASKHDFWYLDVTLQLNWLSAAPLVRLAERLVADTALPAAARRFSLRTVRSGGEADAAVSLEAVCNAALLELRLYEARFLAGMACASCRAALQLTSCLWALLMYLLAHSVAGDDSSAQWSQLSFSVHGWLLTALVYLAELFPDVLLFVLLSVGGLVLAVLLCPAGMGVPPVPPAVAYCLGAAYAVPCVLSMGLQGWPGIERTRDRVSAASKVFVSSLEETLLFDGAPLESDKAAEREHTKVNLTRAQRLLKLQLVLPAASAPDATAGPASRDS